MTRQYSVDLRQRRTIGQLLQTFSPSECANYLAHAGYVPSNRQML